MIDPRLRFRDALTGEEGPAVYTDPAVERAALASGAGVFARSGRRVWRITGTDAIDYLHRMLTQDVAGIAVPGGARACLLNRNGRVLGDFFVWRLEDACLLDAEADAERMALPVLEKFVIADDVSFEAVSEQHVRFALAGPDASEALAACGFDVPEVGGVTSLGGESLGGESLGGESLVDGGAMCHVLGVPHGSSTRFECLAERAGVHEHVEALFDERVTPVGIAAFEHERIRLGEPRQPNELHDGVLFNESRLESAVSWNKGCFPGQEPVVMAKHRGRPPNQLVQLRGAGTGPALQAPLTADGRASGHVTSASANPDGSWIGLGYVPTALAARAEPFDLPDGEGTCTIVSLAQG